jgi:hypothetical protein
MKRRTHTMYVQVERGSHIPLLLGIGHVGFVPDGSAPVIFSLHLPYPIGYPIRSRYHPSFTQGHYKTFGDEGYPLGLGEFPPPPTYDVGEPTKRSSLILLQLEGSRGKYLQ